MKKIASWVSAIATIVFVFCIIGNYDNASIIESDSDLRYDDLDAIPDQETQNGAS